MPDENYWPMFLSYSYGLAYDWAGEGYAFAAFGWRGYWQAFLGSVYKATGDFNQWSGTDNGMGYYGEFCITGTYMTHIPTIDEWIPQEKTLPPWLEPAYLERVTRERNERLAKLEATGWKRPPRPGTPPPSLGGTPPTSPWTPTTTPAGTPPTSR